MYGTESFVSVLLVWQLALESQHRVRCCLMVIDSSYSRPTVLRPRSDAIKLILLTYSCGAQTHFAVLTTRGPTTIGHRDFRPSGHFLRVIRSHLYHHWQRMSSGPVRASLRTKTTDKRPSLCELGQFYTTSNP